MSLIEGFWDPVEFAAAMNRPGPRRTPLPAVGDRVFYRHRHFAEVTAARVAMIQPFPEVDFEYQFRVVCGPAGFPLSDGAGGWAREARPDPWITLRLATDWGHVDTREARLRGSAGWLPADWERRLYPVVIDGRLTFRQQMEAIR